MTCHRLIVLTIPALAVIAGCDLGGAHTQTPSPPRLALWSEYVPLGTVRSWLPFLAEHQLEVNLGITRGEVDFAELEDLLREARREGVTFSLWPELSFADGRWPGSSNTVVFIPYFEEVRDWVLERGLPVETLIVDMEMNYNRAMEMQALAEAGDFGELIDFFLGDLDTAGFVAARNAYATMVDEARARGFRVRLTTLGQLLDDFADGDPTLQVALESPVEGIGWDEVSFQIYRTSYNDLFGDLVGGGEGFSPYLVHDYALTAIEHFGQKAALDLGLIASGDEETFFFSGFYNPADLLADIEAAMAAGLDISRLDLFSLDGLITRPDPGAWVKTPGYFTTASPAPPEEDQGVGLLRRLLQQLDESSETVLP